MYIWINSYYIRMNISEFVRVSDYKEQINSLRSDTYLPKSATNLVYLTNCIYSKKFAKHLIAD